MPAAARAWGSRPPISRGSTRLVPLDGVYAGLAWIDGQGPAWPAACNIGPNPTFGEHARKVEAHLIDFKGDLYGKSIEIDFLERLRGTKKFSGLDELLNQIHADIAETRRICSSSFRVHRRRPDSNDAVRPFSSLFAETWSSRNRCFCATTRTGRVAIRWRSGVDARGELGGDLAALASVWDSASE